MGYPARFGGVRYRDTLLWPFFLKTGSQSAATTAATFTMELMGLLVKTNGLETALESIRQLTPTFDCRVGAYDTRDEALSQILWRAYDCGVNSVSDVAHKSGVLGSKAAIKMPTDRKLAWLMDNDLLPLRPHQRAGTYWVKRKQINHGSSKRLVNQFRFFVAERNT